MKSNLVLVGSRTLKAVSICAFAMFLSFAVLANDEPTDPATDSSGVIGNLQQQIDELKAAIEGLGGGSPPAVPPTFELKDSDPNGSKVVGNVVDFGILADDEIPPTKQARVVTKLQDPTSGDDFFVVLAVTQEEILHTNSGPRYATS
ncbi:MAG: hypothetical protein R3229_12225, partial [Alphaproteobacteria bacterium]|nr:hypothetical protein [Alphaproteobacteria bacterium]